MKCKKCGSNVKMKWGNLTFNKDGIEIILMETPYNTCTKCSDVNLSDDVEELLKNMLEEKKKHSESSPILFSHVKEKLNNSNDVFTY